uniref:Uncharacterized protein n=1 Tax=Rhizophora mucronata TaxID=61149 RepID=A0A2P2P7R9_RHIMU
MQHRVGEILIQVVSQKLATLQRGWQPCSVDAICQCPGWEIHGRSVLDIFFWDREGEASK